MTKTGIIRYFSDDGIIHIPREVRKNVFGRRDVGGMPIEIFYNDESIILKPYKENDNND